jgi:hypothetical protein
MTAEKKPVSPEMGMVGCFAFTLPGLAILSALLYWFGVTVWLIPGMVLFAIGLLAYRRERLTEHWKFATVLCVGMLGVLTFLGHMLTRPKPVQAQPTATRHPDETVAVRTSPTIAAQTLQVTTPERILAAYAANQVKAAKEFSQPFAIKGRVTRVSEALGIGIVHLYTPRIDDGLQVGFVDNMVTAQQLVDVSSGDTVIAQCPRAIEAGGIVLLTACTDVEVVTDR